MEKNLEPILYRSSTVKTLHELFCERVRRTPDAIAYRYCDAQADRWLDISWQTMSERVAKGSQCLETLGAQAGDRCVILLPNSPSWVVADQAALSLNMVTVPLFINDRPENMAHVIQHSQAKFLIINQKKQWVKLEGLMQESCLEKVVFADSFEVVWSKNDTIKHEDAIGVPANLATIIYTSGTTGDPKGVMLSHANILENASAAYDVSAIRTDDLFLSFLPLSHAFERTVGCYLPMLAGATVAFARSIQTLQQDLLDIKPTAMVTVPRMFDKINDKLEEKLRQAPFLRQLLFRCAESVGFRHFQYRQKQAGWHISLLFFSMLDTLVGKKVRASLGGRLRVAVSGGAPLSFLIAKRYLGFGVPIIQGYGLTECSPVVSSNRLQPNYPESVGGTLIHTHVRVHESTAELLVKGVGVMSGYWLQPEATAEVIDTDGWFHTGDIAQIKDGKIYITGRIKDILVLSNGEKLSPTDVEEAIQSDPWIDQVMVVGEGKAFLAGLVVLSPLGQQHADKKVLLRRIGKDMHAFPGYEKVKDLVLCDEPWTVENGLLTPTMKLKRTPIIEKYTEQIDGLYKR